MNIMKRAAQIRRGNKRLTVQQSVKKAAQELRTKKKSAKKRVTVEKKTRNAKPKRVNRVSGNSGGIPDRVNGVKNAIIEKIGILEGKKYKATRLSDKKKIGREITKLKSMYKKLS